MRDFRKYKAWALSHSLTLEVYEVTKQFPRDELFGLTSQVRRAAASTPTNLAEGCGRVSDAEFARFVDIASGSTRETEYQLLLAHDLDYITQRDYARLQKQITNLQIRLRNLYDALKS